MTNRHQHGFVAVIKTCDRLLEFDLPTQAACERFITDFLMGDKLNRRVVCTAVVSQ